MVGNFGSTSKTGKTGFAPCGMADGSPPRRATSVTTAKLALVKTCFLMSPLSGWCLRPQPNRPRRCVLEHHRELTPRPPALIHLGRTGADAGHSVRPLF